MEAEVPTPEGAEVVQETPTTEVAPVVEPIKETPEETAKKKTAQERINEITRLRREAEREAEYWKNKALEKKEPEKPKQSEGRPKVAEYQTVEEYEDALLTWHESKKAVESTLAERNKRKQDAVKQFDDKASTLRTEYDDYDEVISRPVFTEAMKEVLLSSENGPGLAYYLGSNRDIADKIAKLPTELQPYELGKLETQYLIAQKTKKTTNAPEPIVPGSGTGSASTVDESKMTDEEWFKYDQKRKLEKLKKKHGG